MHVNKRNSTSVLRQYLHDAILRGITLPFRPQISAIRRSAGLSPAGPQLADAPECVESEGVRRIIPSDHRQRTNGQVA
ncbi:hypothetical protein Trydic_g3822 [Trypoxylus dichotomus]